MKAFFDAVRKINEFMQTISAEVLTFMIILTTADVILRAFGRLILGTYEVVAICGGIVIGFGVPVTSWIRGQKTKVCGDKNGTEEGGKWKECLKLS